MSPLMNSWSQDRLVAVSKSGVLKGSQRDFDVASPSKEGGKMSGH